MLLVTLRRPNVICNILVKLKPEAQAVPSGRIFPNLCDFT